MGPFDDILPPPRRETPIKPQIFHPAHPKKKVKRSNPQKRATCEFMLGGQMAKQEKTKESKSKAAVKSKDQFTSSEPDSKKSIAVKTELPVKNLESSKLIKKDKDKVSYYYKRAPRKKHTQGRKPKVKQKWTLLCAHCSEVFTARPTPKNSRYVVNHICAMNKKKRKQFVIGVKTRRCMHKHPGPCISQLMRREGV